MTLARTTPPKPHPLVTSYYASLDSPRSRETAAAGLRRVAKALRLTFVDERGRTRGDAALLPWEDICKREDLDSIRLMRARLVASFTPATATHTIAMVRGVLGSAFDSGLISADFFQRARRVLKRSKGQRVAKGRSLPDADIARLLDYAALCQAPKGPMLRAIVLLGLGTGLRRAELCALTLSSAKRDEIVVIGKGNKEVGCPLDDATRAALAEWTRARPGWHHAMLFGTPVQGRPLTGWGLGRLVAELAAGSGVATFAPHDFRRTFASRLLSGGLDLGEVQRLMHHASPATTVIYDRRGSEQLGARRRGVRVYGGA